MDVDCARQSSKYSKENKAIYNQFKLNIKYIQITKTLLHIYKHNHKSSIHGSKVFFKFLGTGNKIGIFFFLQIYLMSSC